VGGTADLNRILDARQPGDEVEVEILRDGRRMVLNMTVMARA
jgi:S1-C subfamily serine protease